jgi:dienelactone hydrolase
VPRLAFGRHRTDNALATEHSSMTTPLTRRQAISLLGALALPLDRLLAEPAAVPSVTAVPGAAPDLGNLYELMDWLKRENAPQLSFLNSRWSSLDPWKAAARPVFRRHLCYDPKPLPLDATVVRREAREGFTLETVRIRATAAYDIPAWVLIPTQRRGRLPAVVALHCHSGQYVWGHEKVLSSPDDSPALGEFRDQIYGRPYAELLARRGYVVIVSDAFYFGERRLRVETVDPAGVPREAAEAFKAATSLAPGSREWLAAVNRVCGAYETLTAKTLFAAGATWPGLLAWDDMRTVDYLASRPEVDPARLGCVGLSLGALRAAHLIAADPRLKVACTTGWMTQFGQQLRNHIRYHTWMAYNPGLYASLDLPDAAALIAPGALLIQECGRDRMYPRAAMQGAIDQLAQIYAKAGIPERFRGTFHDEPHSFRPAMQDEAFAWLDRWL